jgi:hypothetical protein
MSLSSFHDAYLAATEPSDPLTGFTARLWPSGARTAVLLYPENGYAYLAYVKSAAPGEKSGSGSKAVRRLTELADEHDVRLELIANGPRKGRPGLRTRDLRAWYGRAGFVTEHGSRMVRPPGGVVKRSRGGTS